MPDALPRIPSREELRKVLQADDDNEGVAQPPTPPRDATDQEVDDHD